MKFRPAFLQRSPVFAVFVAFNFAVQSAIADDDPESKLVVHEWGVLGVGNTNGTPVLGATDRFLESLPDFVLKNELLAPPKFVEQQPHTVFKPIIHFYGIEGQKLEVTVKVAKGFPIVYFPKPELAMTTTSVVTEEGKFGNLTQAQAMTWKFGLTKTKPAGMLAPPEDHWWHAARRIPSDYVVMDDGTAGERFLFYEGTTYENPSVTAAVSDDSIIVTNNHTAESAPVVLILNDHGKRSGVYIDPIASGKTATLSRKSFTPWEDETLFAHCRKQWETCGMTVEEAKGIVDCWRPELLDTAGFLLISRIPEPIYETIFPIEIKPAPAELTRACLVFDTLAGQTNRKHWIPNLAKAARDTFSELAEADFERRLKAQAKLIRWGEITFPFGEEILAQNDIEAQLRMATSTLMRMLSESPVCAHPLPQISKHPFINRGFVPGFPEPIPRVIELDIPPEALLDVDG